MKKKRYLLTLLATVFNLLNLYSQPSNDLIGIYDINLLKKNDKYPWFDKTYAGYSPDTALVSKLIPLINDNVKITVVAGTWCGDTRRELPKFIKILDKADFDKNNLNSIFVNTNKSSPGKAEKKLKIKSVPSFIVYIDGIEKGRIIEKADTTFEQDLLNILSK